MTKHTLNHNDIVSPLLPPYDDFTIGIIKVRGKDNRRYITFRKPAKRGHRKYPWVKIPKGTTYARYLFQVDYWNKYQKMIPSSMEVDHINDDCTDDRLENFQLLSARDNTQKRSKALLNYTKVPEGTIDNIRMLLECGLKWNNIVRHVGVSPGQLRYIVDTYIPDYAFDKTIKMNLSEIKKQVIEGRDSISIGLHFGVSGSTIRRIIRKFLPDYKNYAGGRDRAKMKKQIGVLLEQGECNLTRIAELVGCTGGNVLYIARRYYPKHYRTIQEKFKKEGRNKVLGLGPPVESAIDIERIRKYLEDHPDHTHQGKLAEALGYNVSAMYAQMKAYWPEGLEILRKRLREKDRADTEVLKKILDVGDLSMSKQKASEISGFGKTRIDYLTRKYIPGWSKEERIARKHAKAMELYRQGKSIRQISLGACITPDTVKKWISECDTK